MNSFEKTFSVLAIFFALGLLTALLLFPQLHQLEYLIPLSLLGLVVNTGLLFVVLRDILAREFRDRRTRYLWIGLVLICWPAIFYYLPRYGFRTRV